MNRRIAGPAALAAAALALPLAGCAATDIVAKYASSSFEAVAAASGERVSRAEEGAAWTLASPGGDRIAFSTDFSRELPGSSAGEAAGGPRPRALLRPRALRGRRPRSGQARRRMAPREGRVEGPRGQARLRGQAPQALRPAVKLVLVADDEAKIVKLVCAYLEAAGFAALPAFDGRAALEAARSRRPDCAVLDIGMPGMDGLDLARELRVLDPELPIIFLTARSEEADRVLGLETRVTLVNLEGIVAADTGGAFLGTPTRRATSRRAFRSSRRAGASEPSWPAPWSTPPSATGETSSSPPSSAPSSPRPSTA